MATNCEMCVYYILDENTENYECSVNMDEDEVMRFLQSPNYDCPYFNLDDEYSIVRKQN